MLYDAGLEDRLALEAPESNWPLVKGVRRSSMTAEKQGGEKQRPFQSYIDMSTYRDNRANWPMLGLKNSIWHCLGLDWVVSYLQDYIVRYTL
jgi:hypothetical protein